MCNVFFDLIRNENSKNILMSYSDKSYFLENFDFIYDFIEHQKTPAFILSYNEKNKRQSMISHGDYIFTEVMNDCSYLKLHSLISSAIVNSMEDSNGNDFFWFSDNKSFKKISVMSFNEIIHCICDFSIQVSSIFRPSEIVIRDITKLSRSDVITMYLKSRMAMCCKDNVCRL